MRLKVLTMLQLGFATSMLLSAPLFATAAENAVAAWEIHNILLKSPYNQSVKAGRSWYLWDKQHPANYIDKYYLSANGQLQFLQRIRLPEPTARYDASSKSYQQPELRVIPVGNWLLTKANDKMTLIDPKGTVHQNIFSDNAEATDLFGLDPAQQVTVDLVSHAGNYLLLWSPHKRTLSRWQLAADNKLQLIRKSQTTAQGDLRLISNGPYSFLMGTVLAGYTDFHSIATLTMTTSRFRQAPADVDASMINKTVVLNGDQLIMTATSEKSATPALHRVKLGTSAQLELVSAASVKTILGNAGSQLYFENDAGQLCRLDTLTAATPACQAMPAQISALTSVSQTGDEIILLGQNGVFLQPAADPLKQVQQTSPLQPKRPGLAAVPQGVVTADKLLLIDALENATALKQQQGTGKGCGTLHSTAQPQIFQAEQPSIAEVFTGCTSIHQLQNSNNETTVTLNARTYQHPGFTLLAHNPAEALFVDGTQKLWAWRAGETAASALNIPAFTAASAVSTDNGWYLLNRLDAQNNKLYFLPKNQLNATPSLIATQATAAYAASASHLYWLDIGANGQQLVVWQQNGSSFQRLTEVAIPAELQPQTDAPLQMQLVGNQLALWYSRVNDDYHSSLLLFDISNPEQPQLQSSWRYPVRSANKFGDKASFSQNSKGLIVQSAVSGEILQLGAAAKPYQAPPHLTAAKTSDKQLLWQHQIPAGTEVTVKQQPAQGRLTVAADGLYFELTNADISQSSASLLIETTDGSSQHNFNLTLNEAPQPPAIIENALTLAEDSKATLKLTLKNADGMQLSILTKPLKGTASLNGNELSYQPNANLNGDDSLVLALSNASNSYQFPLKLQITAMNDAPVLAPVAALELENGKTVTGQAVATDVDGDALSYRISKTGVGTATIAADGKFSYQAKAAGNDSFVIEVQDAAGASAQVTVNVKVTEAGTTVPPTVPPVPPVTPDSGKKSGGSLGFWSFALLLCWCRRFYGKA